MRAIASHPTLRRGESDAPTLRLRDPTPETRLSQTKVEKLLDWADASRHPDKPTGAAQDKYVKPAQRSDVERWITHKASLPQLGPVKYKLSCESTPFGGQLPHEAKVTGAGRAARGARRDISYLTDSVAPKPRGGRLRVADERGAPSGEGASSSSGAVTAAGAGTPGAAPPSLIPGPFHLMLEAPFPLSHVGIFGEMPDDSWTRSTASKLWQACVFPSAIPSGRRDVILLQEWMTEMLARLTSTQNLEEEELVHEAQTIFSVCFHEVIRQVAVHCAERGHLMAKIWISNMELFERLAQLMTNVKLQMVLQNEHVGLERAQLLKRVKELEDAKAEGRDELERARAALEAREVELRAREHAREERAREAARPEEVELAPPPAEEPPAPAPAAAPPEELWPSALGDDGRSQWSREMEAMAEHLEGVAREHGFQSEAVVDAEAQTDAAVGVRAPPPPPAADALPHLVETVDDATQTEAAEAAASDEAEEVAGEAEDAVALAAAQQQRGGMRRSSTLAVLNPANDDAHRLKPWRQFLPSKKLPKPKGEWNEGRCVNTIAKLYEDKIKADAARDSPGPWAQFVYMWHMHHYGLKTLARKNLAALLASCMHWAAQNERIKTFTDLCGLAGRPYHERRLHFVTRVLRQLYPQVETISEHLGADDMSDAFVPLGQPGGKRSNDAADVVMGSDELRPNNEEVLELLHEHVFTNDSKQKVLLVDTLLTVLLDAFERTQTLNRERMLLLFEKFDTNGDGVLSIEEFTALLKACDPELTAAKCEDIYLLVQDRSEKLAPDVGDAILPAAFVLVAEEYNLDTNPDD